MYVIEFLNSLLYGLDKIINKDRINKGEKYGLK